MEVALVMNFILHSQTSQDEAAWLLQNLREQVCALLDHPLLW